MKVRPDRVREAGKESLLDQGSLAGPHSCFRKCCNAGPVATLAGEAAGNVLSVVEIRRSSVTAGRTRPYGSAADRLINSPGSQPMPEQTPFYPRLLGRIGRAGPGRAVLVVIGGIHGNEPAGVQALSSVLSQVGSAGLELRGEFIGLVGNRAALSVGRRFIRQDLNRMWTQWQIRKSSTPGAVLDSEEREQRDLAGILAPLLGSSEDVYLLDLHTTSSQSAPFAVLGDTLENRDFAFHFPVPLVLGLEELIEGVLTEYVGQMGIVALGFEAGHHSDPCSTELSEAAIWLALSASGMIPLSLPAVGSAREKLTSASTRLPRLVEVRYRHPVHPADHFRMASGYVNFQAVRRGEVVADDRYGAIAALENGRIFLPLYQKLGEDGFFIVRELGGWWLRLSRGLRKLRLDYLIPLLPGFRRQLEPADSISAEGRIAHWLSKEFLHLLGYRRRRTTGRKLILTKRKNKSNR